jgi:uncharacterized protein with ParB-like and HNH nuclease domain
MQSEAQSLRFMFNEGLIHLPFFQREYVWSQEHWEYLLSDLLKIGRPYYLGTLVFKALPQQTGKPKEVLLIDGQQRLTTINILLKVLFNGFDKESKNKFRSVLKNFFYVRNIDNNDVPFIKLSHSKVDKTYYEMIINGTVDDNTPRSSNLIKCFDYYTQELERIEPDAKIALFNQLINSTDKIFAIIDLNDHDDEQKIYDSINSTGVRLGSSDMIKNTIFQRQLDLTKIKYNNDQQKAQDEIWKLYEQNWQQIFLNDEETVDYWDKQTNTGVYLRTNLELLLFSIGVIKDFFDGNNHKLSDLASTFKHHINNLSVDDLKNFIVEIREYGIIYKENFLKFQPENLLSFDDSHKRLHCILDTCGYTSFNPYILDLYKRYNSNETKLNEELKKIESLIIRRIITNSPTNNYNKMCKEFILNNSAIDKYLSETPDKLVRSKLREKISPRYAKLILFWIELYRRKNKNYDITYLPFIYTLEHILPQKWEEHWSDVPIIGPNNMPMKKTEAAKNYRNELLNTIGNMTLLTGKLNVNLQNLKFDEKVNGSSKSTNTLRNNSELDITKSDIIGPYDKGKTVWNEQRIRERTEVLTKNILEIW